MISNRADHCSAYGYTGQIPAPRPGFHSRVAGSGGEPPPPMGTFHPVARQPMTQPLVRVRVSADRVQVEDLVPLYGASGTSAAPIPAQAPGRWFQLYATGRPLR